MIVELYLAIHTVEKKMVDSPTNMERPPRPGRKGSTMTHTIRPGGGFSEIGGSPNRPL